MKKHISYDIIKLFVIFRKNIKLHSIIFIPEHIFLYHAVRNEVNMKKIKHTVFSFIAVSAFTLTLINPISVSAATKEDVIAAAQNSTIDQSTLQAGINYLQSHDVSPEDCDRIISALKGHSKSENSEMGDWLEEQKKPESGSESSDSASSGSTSSETGSGSSGTGSEKIDQIINDYAQMSPDQKEDYINNLTIEEKKEIIKNLDQERQLEIINGYIDVGEQFGLHVTLDNISENNITYSVRNSDGNIVDINNVGVMVDDTGIDYSFLIIGSAMIIVLSCGAIAVLAYCQKNNRKMITENSADFGGADNE